jgi:hypothetical protein
MVKIRNESPWWALVGVWKISLVRGGLAALKLRERHRLGGVRKHAAEVRDGRGLALLEEDAGAEVV